MPVIRYHVRDSAGAMHFNRTEVQKDAMVTGGGEVVNTIRYPGTEKVPSPPPEAPTPATSPSDLVLQARLSGFEGSMEEQLRLWGEGEITAAEFQKRKTALEGGYLEWYEGFEETGATPTETKAIVEARAGESAAQLEATAKQILTMASEGEITMEQAETAIKHYTDVQLKEVGEILSGEDVHAGESGLSIGYTFAEPTYQYRVSYVEDQVAKEKTFDTEAEAQTFIESLPTPLDIEAPPALEEGPELALPLTERELEHMQREREWTADYVPPVDIVAPLEELVPEEKAELGIIWDPGYGPTGPIGIVDQKTVVTDLPDLSKFAPLGGPGPAGGPAPGSIGEKIQEAFDEFFEAEEEFFTGFTDPMREQASAMIEASMDLPAEGAALEGLGLYLGGVAIQTGVAVFEGVTEIIRPKLIEQQLGDIGRIVSDVDIRIEEQAKELKEAIEAQDLIFQEYTEDISKIETGYLEQKGLAEKIISEQEKYTPESFTEFEEAWATYEAEVTPQISVFAETKEEYAEWREGAEVALGELEAYSPRTAMAEHVLSDPFSFAMQMAGGAVGGYLVGRGLGKLLDVVGVKQTQLTRLEALDIDVKATALELVEEFDPITGKSVKVPRFAEVEITPTSATKRIPKVVSELMEVELEDFGGPRKILGVVDEGGLTALEQIEFPKGSLDELFEGKPVTLKEPLTTKTVGLGSEKFTYVDELTDPLTGHSMQVVKKGKTLPLEAKELSSRFRAIDEVGDIMFKGADDVALDQLGLEIGSSKLVGLDEFIDPRTGKTTLITKRRVTGEKISITPPDDSLTVFRVIDEAGVGKVVGFEKIELIGDAPDPSKIIQELDVSDVPRDLEPFMKGIDDLDVTEFGGRWYDVGVERILEKGKYQYDVKGILIEPVKEVIDDSIQPIRPGEGPKTPWSKSFGVGEDVIQEVIAKEITEGVLPTARVLETSVDVPTEVTAGLGLGATLEGPALTLEKTVQPPTGMEVGASTGAPLGAILGGVLDVKEVPISTPITDPLLKQDISLDLAPLIVDPFLKQGVIQDPVEVLMPKPKPAPPIVDPTQIPDILPVIKLKPKPVPDPTKIYPIQIPDILPDIKPKPKPAPPIVDPIQIPDVTQIIDVTDVQIQEPTVTPIQDIVQDVVQKQKQVLPPVLLGQIGPRGIMLPPRGVKKPRPERRRVSPMDPLGFEERRYPVSSIEDVMGVHIGRGRRRAPRRPSRGRPDPSDLLLGRPKKPRKPKKKKKKKKSTKKRKRKR